MNASASAGRETVALDQETERALRERVLTQASSYDFFVAVGMLERATPLQARKAHVWERLAAFESGLD